MNRTCLLVSALALSVAVGCAKESGESKSESAQKPAAAAVKAPTNANANANKAETATPVAAEEGTSCDGPKTADAEGAESECSKQEGGLGCNTWDEAAAKVLEKEVPTNALWQTFQVSGMKCGGCERRVIAKLGEIEGVVGVEADAELGQVRFATLPESEAAKSARTALEGLYKIEKKL